MRSSSVQSDDRKWELALVRLTVNDRRVFCYYFVVLDFSFPEILRFGEIHEWSIVAHPEALGKFLLSNSLTVLSELVKTNGDRMTNIVQKRGYSFKR